MKCAIKENRHLQKQYNRRHFRICIVLYCIVLYCIVLYCIVLYCIVLYCIVKDKRVLERTNVRYIIPSVFDKLPYTVKEFHNFICASATHRHILSLC
jgi:hypothetical protein